MNGNGAIEALDALGHPFWSAQVRTDRADWLVNRGRAHEAALVLETAIETFTRLGAAPALARARDLVGQAAAVAPAAGHAQDTRAR